MTTTVTPSAAQFLANATPREMVETFYEYGDAAFVHRLCDDILRRRARGSLPATMTEFAEMVSDAMFERPLGDPMLELGIAWQRLCRTGTSWLRQRVYHCFERRT